MTTHPHHRKHLAAMIHKHTDEAMGAARRAATIRNAPAAVASIANAERAVAQLLQEVGR